MFSTTRGLLWCVLCLVISSGTCAVYTMTCDQESLVLKGTTTSPLQGTVDTSVIKSANCGFGSGTKVTFQLTPPGGIAINICELPFPSCPVVGQKDNQECRCESSSGILNTYQLDFFFDEAYLHGVLQITTDCAKSDLPPPVVCENLTDICRNKTCNGHGTCMRTGGGTCECDSGYSGENCETEDDCDYSSCSDCNDAGGCWGFITTIAVLVVFVISFIAVLLFYCFCRKQTDGKLGCIYRCFDRCLCKKHPDPTDETSTCMTGKANKPPNASGKPGNETPKPNPS